MKAKRNANAWARHTMHFLPAAAAVFFLVHPVFAVSVENTGGSLGFTSTDLITVVVRIINWALGLLALVAVIFVIYGGYIWLTAAGNEERITKAKKILINATIGIVIVLLSWTIVNYILKLGQDLTNDNGGGGSGSCTAGEQSGCYTCNTNGGWDYNPSNQGCSLPQDSFEIRNLVTSCSNNADYRNDVFLCSDISVIFNRVVDTANLQQLVETTGGDQLTVEQCGNGSDLSTCVTPSQPAPVFNDQAPTITYAANGTPTDKGAEIVANGKSVSFVHQALFPKETYYRVTIPKTIKDTSGKTLSGCDYADGSSIPGCTDKGSTFQWIFHVGSNTDTTPPKPVSSYPVFSATDQGYPDRNVDRAPIITMQFDSALAPWTISDDTVQIFPYTTAPDDQGNGGILDTAPISKDSYDVFVNNAGDGFALSFKAGFQLDTFRWYRISVDGVNDLCSNKQSPSPVAWSFETNGIGAGVAQVYPSDGFKYACPNTELFVGFTTSMYDPSTSSCEVSPGGKAENGGFVTAGSEIRPRTFRVEDDIPATGNPNPNNYCKKYSWLPSSSPLAINANYAPTVSTRYPIDNQGGTLKASWSFTTTEPGKCANVPYINSVSPAQGQAGRCMSVIGQYFDQLKPEGRGENLTFLKPDGSRFTVPKSDIKSWVDASIVTNAPDLGATTLPYSSPITVSVDYGSPIGVLTSDANNPLAQFTYNTTGTYDGPCLYSLNPDQSYHGNGYSFSGERFNASSSTKKIHFGNDIACTGSACWTSDSDGHSSVPATAPENTKSDVALQNDKGTSNALPFFVNQVPLATFQVLDFAPSCQGTESCLNASVYARFSQSLKSANVTGGEIATDGSFELFQCDDQECARTKLHEVQTDLLFDGKDTVDFAQHGGLAKGKWYRAVIHGGPGGVLSVDDKQLGDTNFDFTGDNIVDSYSWVFGTTVSADLCSVSSVSCQPATTIVSLDGTRQLTAHAFSQPNECHPGGTELNAHDYSWNWASDDERKVSVAPVAPGPTTQAHGLVATTVPTSVQTSTQSLQSICQVTVSTSSCITDDDCSHDAHGNLCGGSHCVDNSCSPSVTSITPNKGIVGDWVTVKGCFFGQFQNEKSKVLFLQDNATEDLVGLWPLTSICGDHGSTWTDAQIIVEVPNKGNATKSVTKSGPLRVVRADSVTADSAEDFDPTGVAHPGICQISPSSGQAGTTKVTLKGNQFGATAGSNDKVTFYSNQDVSAAATTWSDTVVSNVTVPALAKNSPDDGQGEVTLTHDGQVSNSINFDVTPASCNACTSDSQCSVGKQACVLSKEGSYSCCTDKLEVVSYGPQGNTVCRNSGIMVKFQDAFDRGKIVSLNQSSVNPTTVILKKGSTQVSLAQNNFIFPSSDTFLVNPGVLDKETEYSVVVHGGASGILNADGLGLNSDLTWSFTTLNADSMCAVDAVQVDPPSYLFTTIGGQQTFTANAYGPERDTPIFPVPGVYDWTWGWKSSDEKVSTISQGNATAQTATAVANGSATITATATGTTGWTGSKSGTASVQVSACIAAWPNNGQPVPFNDTATNYATWYCRDHGTSECSQPDDNGETVLCTTDAECTARHAGSCLFANVNVTAADGLTTATGDQLLHQFFFEYPYENAKTHKRDVIGMLVWQNQDHLSPSDWYAKKFSQTVSPSTFTVDGYQAMRIGTTTYVAGTNLAGNTLYTNMYVLGYNEDAGSETVAVFNQMLSNLKLNSNIQDFGGSQATLDAVRRDTQRLGDLMYYANTMTAYQVTQGFFPTLLAGSYLSGMSTSVWPSWSQALASELQLHSGVTFTPKVDPLNTLSPACQAPYDPATCWDTTAKQFQCPASEETLLPDNSHIYAYKTPDGGKTYSLYAHLDYDGPGSWQGVVENPCTGTSKCACFNYRLEGSGGGNGVSADSTKPSIPQDLHASSQDGNISLTWSASNDFGGSGVYYYKIYRSETGGGSYHDAGSNVTHPTTAFTDTGLQPGFTYYYKVSAVDTAGNESDPSSAASATP